MILDTTFLVDLLRGESELKEAARHVDDHGIAAVSTITVMELGAGIHRADASETERERVETLLSDIREVPFDRDAAFRAGELNVQLARSGTPIDVADVTIAATALVHDQPVVTRNVDHFERIDDLAVLTY